MEQSKVYFSDLRAPVGTNLLRKLEKLIRRAGIGDIDMEKKLVAIKLHFGEPGNLTYLRPNYAKVVADVVKSLGGVPFLTDCNPCIPGAGKTPWSTWRPLMKTVFHPFPPAVMSSLATACGAPTMWRSLWRGRSISRPPRSGGPLWTRMCLSA